MSTATAIVQLDALDATISFATGILQPILDANNGVWPANIDNAAYYDSLQEMRLAAQNAKLELMTVLDIATKMDISRIHADRQGR